MIPDKIYFKIGEVCDLVGVQAHVLRYWETEFPTLSPQKNKSGQRSYRRRDVEIALRIKQLLYKEMFTIAGARKKLQSDLRDGSKAKEKREVPEPPPPVQHRTAEPHSASLGPTGAPLLFDAGFVTSDDSVPPPASSNGEMSPGNETYAVPGSDRSALIRSIGSQLLEIREMLKAR